MSEEVVQPKPTRSTPLVRRIGIYAAILLLVFLLGFFPMWLRARDAAARLAVAEQQLSLARIRNDLASATIDARRGDYEPARQAASQFFTSLRTEVDRGDTSALTEAQRTGLQPLFTQRDEVITLLARNDAAAADRLSDLYASYRKLVSN